MRLKYNLLIPILNNDSHPQKYSRAYMNLKNVLELEHEEEQQKGKKILSKEIEDQFKFLETKYKNFLNKIPLIVIEKYFLLHKDELNKYVSLRYKELELSDLQVVELFEKFEEYFNKCFNIACRIADLYNIEIKLNENKESQKNNNNNYF
ncbi:MAG: hypothetical protein ACTSRG_23955 [Candidatus Helarchaeota archaeon]